MSAAAGFFLLLLPLAALPVIFHLFLRRRRKRLVFSTLMFFHRVDPRLSARRKLREWLLLACRVALIALVLLALAGLTIHSTGGLLGLYGKQAVVVIIDNSASMSGSTADGKRTKLRLAVDSVRALLGHLDSGAEAAIVLLVPDVAAGFESAGMTGDVESLAQGLDRITPSDGTGNPAAAIARANAMLRSASASGGAIHVFTDLQNSEWEQKIDARNTTANVQMVLHRIATPLPVGSNVAIVQAELIGQRILPKQPYQIQVVLRNDDNADVQVRLNSEDDQRKAHTEVVDLAAGKEKTVRLLVQPEAPGYHWVKLWVEGDRFAGDNRATVGYQCEEKALVLLVGAAEQFGVLPFALSPYGDGRFTSLVLNYIKADELTDRVDKLKPALVVMTWDDFTGEAPKTLEPFVKTGGNLAVLPSTSGLMTPVMASGWLGTGVDAMQTLESNAAVEIIDKAAPFWSGLRTADGRVQFGRTSARQFCALTLAKDKALTPLLGVGEKVVLASGRIGKGQVVVSGLAFDETWTTLPGSKAMVVIAQTMALGGKLRETNGLSAVAGQTVDLPGAGEEVQMVSLVGDPLDWSGPRGQVPVLPRSGACSVRIGEQSYCLSVRSSDREGSSKFLETTTVPALAGVPHSVRVLEEQDLKEALTASRTGFPLFLPLLMLAVAALIAESLLAAPPLRKKEENAEQTTSE